MRLSIVTTLFNSSNHIEEFYTRVKKTVGIVEHDSFEIIFVDDGSSDDSASLAAALAQSDPNVVLVEFSRNFGHHQAIMAGLKRATGDYVYLLDSDLEEEPEWLLDFWNMLKDTKSEVVFGVQKKRKGGVIERITGNLYYLILNLLSEVKFPKNLVTARLMSRDYVDAVLLFTERHSSIGIFYAYAGFKQTPLEVDKKSLSKSSYSFFRKLNLALRGFANTSSRPLTFVFFLGLIIATLTFIIFISLFLRQLFYGYNINGWTSLMLVNLFTLGLIMTVNGLIGLYVGSIFEEVKRRPRYIVKNTGSRDDANADNGETFAETEKKAGL